ncbi:DUF1972 domain-containing protein [Croceimicrobium hydrocarbonivorans]|uniref:DUF1972 domain-containing protein n=1 Tax=Croceimicrobium hydrocarbonivorans TaxID=2761580 RepID=A0A7H0VC51_9FLAO|nr:DUF1972 domain-containing protein [Croceimicrobium hydrocarbonivorans]QNR23299.1 DUF1972 domain-containing protein [Croceimicrobium hydrocarbonivorans]
MKIGIIGTRGIPNLYGGFEECAQQLGLRLVEMGHQVWVYNSHRHPYDQKNYQGIEIIHKYDPEHRYGTIGQFIYDLNCIIDSRKRKFDAILLLGYTSSSVWQRLLPKRSLILCNMDGLEWKRSKYSPRVQKFLKYAEKWAARRSDILIADSTVIQEYLESQYPNDTVFIPYGADIFKKGNPEILDAYGLDAGDYNLLVARLEPENHIEMILQGVVQSESQRLMLVVGNHDTPYGEYLKEKFKDARIRFVRGTYKKDKINNLRYYSHLYFHGHSVGGTNPSLLEAMACGCSIVAHRNRFNYEVLGENASYFSDHIDVANHLDHMDTDAVFKERIQENRRRIEERYNWQLIAEEYEITMQQGLIRKRP